MTKTTKKQNKQDRRKDAVYARQSIDKKDSLSIEAQIDLGLKNADEGAEIYEDKGYSGKNIDRPDLQRLKADIEANKIKRVLVYRLDRISRNIADFYKLYELMEEHDCVFQSLTEPINTSDKSGKLAMGMLIMFAELERDSIQERVKDNYYYRIKEDGRWPGGPAPKGFDNARTPQNKPTLKANKDIEMVKLAFQLYANDSNISLAKVGRKLYENGYRSNRQNGQFDNVTIARILQNPVYAVADNLLYKYYKMRKAKIIGDEKTWDGSTSAHIVGKKPGNSNVRKYTTLEEQTIYRTNFEGVVSSAEFISVQERLGKNQQIRRANAPSRMKELAGKVKCAKCGYAIKMNSAPNLNCYGRASLHCCDTSLKIKFPVLQEKVSIEIQKQLDVIAVKLLEESINAKKQSNRIDELNKEIENLVELAAKGTMQVEQISRSIEKRQHEIDEIELAQERNLTFAEQAHINNILPLVYGRLNDDEKKSVVQILIDKILLHENGDIDIIWRI